MTRCRIVPGREMPGDNRLLLGFVAGLRWRCCTASPRPGLRLCGEDPQLHGHLFFLAAKGTAQSSPPDRDGALGVALMGRDCGFGSKRVFLTPRRPCHCFIDPCNIACIYYILSIVSVCFINHIYKGSIERNYENYNFFPSLQNVLH